MGVTVVVAVALALVVPIGGPVTEADGLEHSLALLQATMVYAYVPGAGGVMVALVAVALAGVEVLTELPRSPHHMVKPLKSVSGLPSVLDVGALQWRMLLVRVQLHAIP